MTRKGDRFVARRILHVFDQNLGVGMRFSETFRALAKNGWLHTQRPIADNLRFLVEQKKIVHIGNQYTLIQTREDGTKFCVIKDPVEKIVALEGWATLFTATTEVTETDHL